MLKSNLKSNDSYAESFHLKNNHAIYIDYLYGCIFAYGTQINKNYSGETIIKYQFLSGNQQAPIFNKSIALGWAMNQ